MRMAVTWGIGAALVAILAVGCTDLSGEIDDAGHNGYDKQTCTEFKALAMDAEHNMVSRPVALSRAQRLLEGTVHNSDQAIRDGVITYVQAFTAADPAASEAASTALLRICQF